MRAVGDREVKKGGERQQRKPAQEGGSRVGRTEERADNQAEYTAQTGGDPAALHRPVEVQQCLTVEHEPAQGGHQQAQSGQPCH